MSLSDIMGASGLAHWAVAALLIFFVVFVAVVAWIFRPGRRREMERASRMPLDDEHVQTPRSGDET